MFDSLSEKFSDAMKGLRGQAKISEENIEETIKLIRTALLEADVNFKVVKEFITRVKDQALGEKVIRGVKPGEQFTKIVHDELTQMMGGEHKELELNQSPMPILIVGLNGAGKTTFTGKLALYLRSKKKKDIYLIPADNFRPAAKDQLIIHAKNIGVDYFDSDLSLLPKDIIHAGMQKAKELGKEVVLIDTAGRLQVDEELMGQLKEAKESLTNPEVLLVADAMTGQESVNVATTFQEQIGLTGVVLSKMDSDARGGAALSIRYATGLPIRFFSHGEKMKDLDPFHPDRLAKRILDMGDVVSLVEKAQEVVDEKEAEKTLKNLEKRIFTIEDFMKQMRTINKLGSMGSLLKMIPGMGGAMRQMGDLSEAEGEMKGMQVIIDSMTKAERRNRKLLNEDSRLKRISKGCGRPLQEIHDFIQKFDQMAQMMIGMMDMMKGGGAMPGMPGAGKGFRQQPGAQNPMMNRGKKKSKAQGKFGKKYF